MIDDLRNLQRLSGDLSVSLRKVRTKQVYQKEPVKTARNIVDTYFRHIRQMLVDHHIGVDFISKLDGEMHKLLETTHKKTTLSVFRQTVSLIRKTLIEAEKLSLLAGSNATRNVVLDPVDLKIMQTLKVISMSAALSYEQALIDLQARNRLSWRGPATDLREALRELLDTLAPDKDVKNANGFKLEANATRPTMKQKTEYILKRRRLAKNAIKSVQNSIAIVEEMVGSFVRSVYVRASISTHVPPDKSEVIRVHNQVRTVLSELLEIV